MLSLDYIDADLFMSESIYRTWDTSLPACFGVEAMKNQSDVKSAANYSG
jgi:hypothetical protein